MAVPCDAKALGIRGLEALVLSHVRRGARAEDVAEATGLELEDLLRIAEHLAKLGAISVDGRVARRHSARPSKRPHAPARPSGIPAACVPRRTGVADVRSLALGPRRAFVLSQIDGATSAADLAEIVGLTPRELDAELQALEASGLVDLGRAKEKPPPAARATVRPKKEAAQRAETVRPPKEPAPRAPSVRPEQPSVRPKQPSIRPKQPSHRPKRPSIRMKAETKKPPARRSTPPARPAPSPAAVSHVTVKTSQVSASRDRRSALEHAEVFMRAAEEALARGDHAGAHNHYRLALQCSSDPAVRKVIEELGERVKAASAGRR